MVKRVLSVDGGGIRGAAAAQFLELLEAKLGRPLAQVFDFFAGTSTGAIIAAAFGVKGLSAEEIASLYNYENGNAIMNKSVWDRTLGLVQTEPKYDGKGKRKVLERYFGETKLSDALKPTLVVTYDVEKRVSAVLKSHHPDSRDIRAVDAVDASSAAPIYFPTVRVNGRWLIDGGVVANNPSMCAYAEAVRLWPQDEIRLLSVGTGKRTRPISGEQSRTWGALAWITHDLLGVVMDESVVEYQTRMMLGDAAFLRVNSELSVETRVLDDLDETTRENIDALKHLGRRWFDQYGARAFAMLG